MLQQLEGAELLIRQADGRHYGTGSRLRRLAENLLLNATQHGARHAVLRNLVEELGESCNVTALSGNEIVYLDRVETTEPLRFYLHAGSRVPVHCSASGKMIISQMTVGPTSQAPRPRPPATAHPEHDHRPRAASRRSSTRSATRASASTTRSSSTGWCAWPCWCRARPAAPTCASPCRHPSYGSAPSERRTCSLHYVERPHAIADIESEGVTEPMVTELLEHAPAAAGHRPSTSAETFGIDSHLRGARVQRPRATRAGHRPGVPLQPRRHAGRPRRLRPQPAGARARAARHRQVHPHRAGGRAAELAVPARQPRRPAQPARPGRPGRGGRRGRPAGHPVPGGHPALGAAATGGPRPRRVRRRPARRHVRPAAGARARGPAHA